jgi:L-iditol 2-dehydrogenase
MKAAYLTGIRRVELRDVPQPAVAAPADVLLRMEAVGMCGSDMHYFRHGRIGSQVVRFPWTVGHECSGVVVQTGRAVNDLEAGQRVAVDPLISCGHCDQCRGGRRHTCRNQKFLGCPGQAEGCLAEYIIMPRECCFAVPAGVTAVQAALVEPFSIGMYAVRLAGELSGCHAAVLGAGPIGLSVIAAAKADCHCAIYATDIRDNRLSMAAHFGADWIANPQRVDVVAGMLAERPGGLDVVFECAGEQDAIDQALQVLKPGGLLVLVGIPQTPTISLDPDLMRRRELRLQNVRRQNECVEPAIARVAGGDVRLDPMVTHTFGIQQAPEAFELVADYRDGVIKAMVVF